MAAGGHPKVDGPLQLANAVESLAHESSALRPSRGYALCSEVIVLEGLGPDAYVYFVHGYQFRPDSPQHLLARAEYGGPVAAAVGRDNLFGTQFHPEKSQAAGLAIIGNFLRWRP